MPGVTVYDKAKWHFGGDYPPGLDNTYAYTHGGYFFGWIVDHDLVDPEFLEDFSDEIDRFRARDISARELFIATDGALVSDMLNETGNAFASAYFDFTNGQYLTDYDELLCGGLETMYHVEDTAENYAIMSARISKRFNEWDASE